MRLCFLIGWVAISACAAAESVSADAAPPRVASVVRADPRSGRLVRSVAIPSRPHSRKAGNVWAEAARSLDAYVRQTAERYEVDPLLIDSVIHAESNYNPVAVSPKGAQGLMQLMPGTARRFTVTDTFNPAENIDGGVRYLKYLLDLFGDQRSPERLALAAYNAGEGAVAKYGGIPPYRETTQYVNKVVKRWEAKRAVAPKPEAAAASPRVVEFVDARGVVHIQTQYEP